MTAISNHQIQTNKWSQAILKPAQEFNSTPLSVISGEIPTGLQGTLYRNGPGCLQRGGVPVGHWFDGDGAILAVNFSHGRVAATYRFVQTQGYQREVAANRYLYSNYGMTAPGNFWQRLLTPVKNTANTSVLALPDRLLALWEAGKPYALDLETLATLGEDDLGALRPQWNYSAHYKRDGKTGEIWNFGLTPGLNSQLRIYRSHPSGKISKAVSHQVAGIPLIHDFVMAGEYLIFLIPPVRLNLWSIVLGQKSYSDALTWQPNKGTQVLVFDRENLQLVAKSVTEPWFQWHFANGYVDTDGLVRIDFIQYPDFQTNQYLQQVATGNTHTLAVSCLSRVYLQPQTAKVVKVEKILDDHCEFPSVPPVNVGKYSRHTYLSAYRPGTNTQTEIFNAIARFDHQTSDFCIADMGENCYPSEPIFVSNSENPEQGWILTVVYDGNLDSSQVWIYDGDRLQDEPVCRLQLPGFIPPSFHGTWKPV